MVCCCGIAFTSVKVTAQFSWISFFLIRNLTCTVAVLCATLSYFPSWRRAQEAAYPARKLFIWGYRKKSGTSATRKDCERRLPLRPPLRRFLARFLAVHLACQLVRRPYLCRWSHLKKWWVVWGWLVLIWLYVTWVSFLVNHPRPQGMEKP